MQANSTSSVINNYTPAVAGTADYNFVANGAGGASEFAYTVNSSSSLDAAARFLSSGSACGSGSEEADRCWYNPSSTAETIINRSNAAPSGATSTIKFLVSVPSTPNPALEADTYTATGTLTATNNP